MILISAGLSRDGWRKAVRIMGLEKILGEIEGPSARFERDPELFYVSLFGDPAGDLPWGWRLEGHHVSLNFLVAGGEKIACTPNFLGANPARVPRGYSPEGLRILEQEEELARALVVSLAPGQRLRVIFSSEAPPDILTGADQRVAIEAPLGLAAMEFMERQREMLLDLIGEYVRRMPEDLADSRMNQIAREGKSTFISLGPELPNPDALTITASTALVFSSNMTIPRTTPTTFTPFGETCGTTGAKIF